MKWWEFHEGCGDGTTRVNRFRTKEEAETARELREAYKWFEGDGDGSPVIEVDTDGAWFFSDLKDFQNE